VVSEGDCRRRSDADWTLAQRLALQGDYNWATTVAFYAAVHQVNTLMVRVAAYRDDLTHDKRQKFLADNYVGIELAYANMLGKSVRTRYEVGFVADEDFYRRQVRLLEKVRDYVERVLAGKIPGVA
jgi:hypothetical protein